jgi:hypothetical protein
MNPGATIMGTAERSKNTRERKSTGLCGEAQADGVPCADTDCACESCERRRLRTPEPGDHPPDSAARVAWETLLLRTTPPRSKR